MRETIVRNRKSLGLSTAPHLIGMLVQTNKVVEIDVIEMVANTGKHYIIADGLIVGYNSDVEFANL